MDGLLGIEKFEGFGFDPYLPYDSAPLQRIEGSSVQELRDAVRSRAPRMPGVYGMLDAAGRLIYVGKSKLLRSRLLSYFLPNSEDEKAGRIVQSTVEIVWETLPSDFASLLREQYLIRTFRPRFNVQGVPNRQKSLFLCLGRSPAAMFYVGNDLDPKAVAWEGPLLGANRVRRAADVLNRYFQLRDCSNQTSIQFGGQLPLFDLEIRSGCVRHEMQTCLGPCAGGCSQKQYDSAVQSAIAYLKGSPSVVALELKRKMELAATRQHFEQAARFRDDYQILEWLSKRLEEHGRIRTECTGIFPVSGDDGRSIWYCIRRGVVEQAIRGPKTARERPRAFREANDWLESGNRVGSRFVRREENLAIVASWFRKNPEARQSLFNPHERSSALSKVA